MYDFADISNFLLKQESHFSVAFAAASSDMFKEEIWRVYQSAELNTQQQMKDEGFYEKSREEAQQQMGGRKMGLLVDGIKSLY